MKFVFVKINLSPVGNKQNLIHLGFIRYEARKANRIAS